jgi:hypothetical protein
MEPPLITELRKRGEIRGEEVKEIMKLHGRHPRGLGGLTSYDKIKYNIKNDSWLLGPNA